MGKGSALVGVPGARGLHGETQRTVADAVVVARMDDAKIPAAINEIVPSKATSTMREGRRQDQKALYILPRSTCDGNTMQPRRRTCSGCVGVHDAFRVLNTFSNDNALPMGVQRGQFSRHLPTPGSTGIASSLPHPQRVFPPRIALAHHTFQFYLSLEPSWCRQRPNERCASIEQIVCDTCRCELPPCVAPRRCGRLA